MIVRTLLTPSGKVIHQRLGIDEKFRRSGFRPTIKHVYSVDHDLKCISSLLSDQLAFECPFVGKASILLKPIAERHGISVVELLTRLKGVDWSVYGLTCHCLSAEGVSITATGYQILPTTKKHWRGLTGLPLGMAVYESERRRGLTKTHTTWGFDETPSAV